MRDLEEDELGENGDDLSRFGAQKKCFRTCALLLIAVREER